MELHLSMSRLIWAALGICIALVLAGMALSGLRLDLVGLPMVMLTLGSTLLLRFRFKPPSARLGNLIHAIEGIALFCGISMIGALACYPLSTISADFVDTQLADIDAALGFDWVAAYRQSFEMPLYREASRLAYRSISLSPAALIFVLSWRGRPEAVYRLLLAFFVALALTVVLFPVFPARGAFEYYLGEPAPYAPVLTKGWGELITALRAGTLTYIKLDDLGGIIDFPSFHGASALLFLWVAWREKVWRLVLIPLNALMLIATPVEGAHYLVDVIAGAGVMISAILLAGILERRLHHGFHRNFGMPANLVTI